MFVIVFNDHLPGEINVKSSSGWWLSPTPLKNGGLRQL
jgi:hypothetical protein